MDPFDIPGTNVFGPGTQMEPYSQSLSAPGYLREPDRGVAWMRDMREAKPTASPASSVHEMPMPLAPAQISAESSWQIKAPSGMHCRPEWPISSALVWDLLAAQDHLLQREDETRAPPRPPGFRNYWSLQDSLASLTPPLLCADGMFVDTPAEAEALYDILRNNNLVNGGNVVKAIPDVAKLKVMLSSSQFHFSDLKLKRLEWTLAMLYELDVFNREQFEEFHQVVFPRLWETYYEIPYSFVGSFFNRGRFGAGKPRSRRNHEYGARLAYWRNERKWQDDNWGDDKAAYTTPSVPRPAKKSGPEAGRLQVATPVAGESRRPGSAAPSGHSFATSGSHSK